MDEICRFAPTPSGPAHPGTLLAGLLCWLDARSRSARLILRLEDVDAERCTAEHAQSMVEALAWLGLDWDEICSQQERRAAHDAALRALAAEDALYLCTCTRKQIREHARPAADGGSVYPGTCRDRSAAPQDLASAEGALRLRLDARTERVSDESGDDLSADPAQTLGDPVLRRRDGAIAYHLAVVVDDADARVSRVVRGRDLAPATALHVALQRRLRAPTPTYRHHFLLLEDVGRADDDAGKLAKLHGAVGFDELRAHYSGPELCGWLAHAAGLQPGAEPEPTRPQDLLGRFDWSRVRHPDLPVCWRSGILEHG